ncbi:MAG: CDP-alcohol phosphatidyltransferase family protein [Proteobacteria bacterium]|nr:CDP-alcohol phosphatidyltransferase family protein [Pseudomonadota bacterium]
MSHNTWIHRTMRVAVRPLAAGPITPNQVTTLRLAVGLVAAAALAHGDGAWRAWGAGIFVLGLFLDRADGELARLSGKTSPWGHTYDLVSDALSNAFAFFGLGVGLRAAAFGAWAPFMGLLAGLSIAAILWLVIRMEELHGQRAGELQGAAGFDPDDALLVVPVLIWLGLSDWLLAAACLGAPGFAVFMVVKFRAGLRDVGS